MPDFARILKGEPVPKVAPVSFADVLKDPTKKKKPKPGDTDPQMADATSRGGRVPNIQGPDLPQGMPIDPIGDPGPHGVDFMGYPYQPSAY